MKTEIIYQYMPAEGYHIDRVLPVDSDTIVILNTKYRSPSLIHIVVNNSIVQQIEVSEFREFNSSSSQNTLFRYKHGFGLIDYMDTILLWEHVASAPDLVSINNPFAADHAGRRHTAKFADYDEANGHLYFGIENISSTGFPARYWVQLAINRLSEKKNTATWGALHELPVKMYPETKLRQQLEKQKSWDFYTSLKKTDWLNINDIMVQHDKVFIPTDGGELTRLKSGLRYEYSLMSVLSLQNELLDNYEILEGTGNFTFNKSQYLLQLRANRNKIFVYDTADFHPLSEISLSAKQNLGTAKNINLSMNIAGENFYLYNHTFFNVCGIK